MQMTLNFTIIIPAWRFNEGLRYFQGCVIVETLLRLYKVMVVRWGNFSQKYNYEYMAKWWCLLVIEKNYISSLLHRAFRRITLIINQQMHLHKISH